MQGTLVLLFYFAINCRMQQCELELDIPFHYSKVTRKNLVDSNTKLYPNQIHSAGKPLIILISRLVCVFLFIGFGHTDENSIRLFFSCILNYIFPIMYLDYVLTKKPF